MYNHQIKVFIAIFLVSALTAVGIMFVLKDESGPKLLSKKVSIIGIDKCNCVVSAESIYTVDLICTDTLGGVSQAKSIDKKTLSICD